MGLEKEADVSGYDVEMLRACHERHEARLREPGFSRPDILMTLGTETSQQWMILD